MWQATSIRTDEEQNISLGKTGVKYDGRKDKNNSNNPHEKIKQTTIKITPKKTEDCDQLDSLPLLKTYFTQWRPL